jgi:hypothetical protein
LGEHRHPALVEQFTVLEGALSIFLERPDTWVRSGGPERKEFELKPNFLLRLSWRTPRLPHAISASPRKPSIFISWGSGRQPLRGD